MNNAENFEPYKTWIYRVLGRTYTVFIQEIEGNFTVKYSVGIGDQFHEGPEKLVTFSSAEAAEAFMCGIGFTIIDLCSIHS